MSNGEKMGVINLTEEQMVLLSGIASRGQSISARLGQGISRVFVTDGMVGRDACENHIDHAANQFIQLSEMLRNVLSEVRSADMSTENALSEVEDMLGGFGTDE